jgi:hypothetical protein
MSCAHDARGELEKGQREGRERERLKTLLRTSAWMAGTVVFFGVAVPLVWLETSIIKAVPPLAALGRVVFFLFVMIAAVPAGVVWRKAGGDRLKAIEKWERERDDL